MSAAGSTIRRERRKETIIVLWRPRRRRNEFSTHLFAGQALMQIIAVHAQLLDRYTSRTYVPS